MIFPQPLLLISVLALTRSSLSNDVPPDNQIAAYSHRGAGDPCGPYNYEETYQTHQTDFETTIDTCGPINTTFTHAPSIYGVQCLNANPSWHQSINLTSCASNMHDICSTVEGSLAPSSQWSWSSGGPNCTMGIWVNPHPAAQLTDRDDAYVRCLNDIYALMGSTCFTSPGGPFNVAAVNLQTLPDLGTNGSQVDTGYPSYIIVPETYNDNTG